MTLRHSSRRPAGARRHPGMVLNRAMLRAFVHGSRDAPPRAQILRCPAPELARGLADLHSDEAARFLSLMPAGRQIAIITALDPATRARLARDCQHWRCTVPLLSAAPMVEKDASDGESPASPLAAHQQSVAKWGRVGPLGRH